MLFGEFRPLYKDPSEPELFIYVEISSNYKDEMEFKKKLVGSLMEEYKGESEFDGPITVAKLISLEDAFSKFGDFPTRLDFLLDNEGGGLTWIGTYGPTSKYIEGDKNWERDYDKT